MDNKKQSVIVIVGPTAVGKSRLAVDLATHVHGLLSGEKLESEFVLLLWSGEIVGVDSIQVYRGQLDR